MTLFEVDEAANRIRSEVDPDATIIFGSAFDEKLEGVMRVSVVATGIEAMEQTSPLPFINEPNIMQPPVAQPQMQTPAYSVPSIQPVAPMMAEEAPAAQSVTASTESQPMQAETAEAAEMPVMELDQPEAEEQLDIETAVKSAQESDHMLGDTEPQTDRLTETEKAETAIAEPRGHEQATVIRRPLFIPDAPRDVGLDEELVETAPVPEEAPRTSLINRISGLWSGKTDSASAASADSASAKEEPQLNRSDVTLPSIEEPAIMDLPKADMVQTSLPVDPVTKEEEAEENDLDIPAFLRRQAN